MAFAGSPGGFKIDGDSTIGMMERRLGLAIDNDGIHRETIVEMNLELLERRENFDRDGVAAANALRFREYFDAEIVAAHIVGGHQRAQWAAEYRGAFPVFHVQVTGQVKACCDHCSNGKQCCKADQDFFHVASRNDLPRLGGERCGVNQ